ncbi:MAG TPA: YdjY domain-containing protein [Phycisphaerae bacterium]|nr:YdjY domain-containing protein [Phycisphaerae bacterium]
MRRISTNAGGPAVRLSALLALALGCWAAAADPPAAATKPSGLIRLKHLKIDRANRQIVFEANVCYNPGPLEVLVCKHRTKDHESILHTFVQPSHLHAAMLAMGLTPGKPARMSRALTQPARFLPPAGPELSIVFRWKDKNGKPQQADASRWLANLHDKKTPPPVKWIFVGSEVLPGGGYWADEDGAVISLSNFPSAVIDVPFESTADNTALEYTGNKEAIPPKGTPVEVVITVAKGAESAPAARMLLEIDRLGRFWVEDRQYPIDALSKWAAGYIEKHTEGQVVVRALPGATVQDLERAKDELQMGGVADIDEQRLITTGEIVPQTGKQAAWAMETWRRRFANAKQMLTDPIQDAEAHLKQIQREIDELDRRKAMLGEYRMHLREALAKHKASTQPAVGQTDKPQEQE